MSVARAPPRLCPTTTTRGGGEREDVEEEEEEEEAAASFLAHAATAPSTSFRTVLYALAYPLCTLDPSNASGASLQTS